MPPTPSVCCDLLGVTEDATLADVRRAYRKLARRLHPDVVGGDPRRFTEITAAYNLLIRRPDLRRAANAESRAADSETPPRADDIQGEPRWGTARLRAAVWQRFRALAVRFTPRAGADLHLAVDVDLERVLRGGRQPVTVERHVACAFCPGNDLACACLGLGRILLRERLEVFLPPGAHAGAKVRLRGKGDAGRQGGRGGDLYLHLEPRGVPGFTRAGADLRALLTLDAARARDGGALRVITPWGPVRLDVPAGTRAGTKFRLRGQGLPRWHRVTRGDLFLRVRIS